MNNEHVTRAILEALDRTDVEGYRPRSYSGRAMYGRYCLGIVMARHEALKAVGRLVKALGEVADDATIEDFLEQDPCQDSMGHDAIVYWPNLPWLDAESEEEDEESASSQVD